MKNVIRGFVMLSVIFGLMVMGCPTEDKGNDDPPYDPAGGKTVAAEYRGTYKKSDQTYSWTVSEKNFYIIGTNFRVWTEGSDLWVYARATDFDMNATNETYTKFKMGHFETNKLVIEVSGWRQGDYIKQ